MRAFYRILALCLLLCLGNTIAGQNPFWTFPKEYWKVDVNININDLPDNTFSSYTHAGIMDPYDGQPATNLSASYSDDNGNLILFTVDDKVYDRNGNRI